MRIQLKLSFIFAAFFLLAGMSSAAEPVSYKVSMTLSHGGEPFASPSFVVQPDKPASFEVTGTDGYKLTLIVTDLGPDAIKVATTVDSAYGSMAPTITARPSEPAAYTVGGLGLDVTVTRSGG